MSHHGYNDFSPMDEELRQKLVEQLNRAAQMGEAARRLGLGATGQFPDGKLKEDDEGEISIAATVQNGEVVLNFGKPIAWIGFTPEQAEQIGYMLIQKAGEAKGSKGRGKYKRG